MTGGEAVIETLAVNAVDTIFGIPGGHSLAIYDALAQHKSIRHILGRHEQGLGFMADGYARASGRIGVAITTSGPGVVNLAAALGGATTDTSSVLVVSSAVHSNLIGKNRGGLHDCGNSIEILRPLCRYTKHCRTIKDIPNAISEIIYKLRSSRPGGAFCEIPTDILNSKAEVEIPPPRALERIKPDDNNIDSAVRLLAVAKKPLLWVGTGATISDAGPEVGLLSAKLGAIVVPTTLGRGILPADHPNVISADGASVTEVDKVISEADVVLAVGTMFKQEDTAGWTIKTGQKLIHIDIDPSELGRSYEPEIGIVADAKTALSSIIQRMPERDPVDPSWIAQGKRAEIARLNRRREQALDILRNTVPRDGILVCDRCSLGYWAFRCLPVYTRRTFQYPMGYGALGGALPQAFGAKLACPDKIVVCVIGDGGFQFTAPELAVAVQENIQATIILCNNHAYGAIRASQDRNWGKRHFGSELKNPDFAKLVDAYGISYAHADNLEVFKHVLAGGIQSAKLNLIEITFDISDP